MIVIRSALLWCGLYSLMLLYYNNYLAYAYCYLRGKYGAFTSYINCTCIDLLFNWLAGVALTCIGIDGTVYITP